MDIKGANRNPSVCALVVTVATDPSAPVAPITPIVAKGPLSAREVEILTLASNGKTAADMALVLAITERTVAFHINNIAEKLGAANKTHAVALALRQGLIS